MMTICLIHTGLDQGMGSDWCLFDLIASPLFAPSFFWFRTIAVAPMESLLLRGFLFHHVVLRHYDGSSDLFLEDWIHVDSDWLVPPRHAHHLAGMRHRASHGGSKNGRVWWDWEI